MIKEQYTAHVISPIELFDELIRLQLGKTAAYQTARQTAWTWLMTYPMQNNIWSNYFEDVAIQSGLGNFNQLNALMVARYLLGHPELDPSWEQHVRGIIAWVESTFRGHCLRRQHHQGTGRVRLSDGKPHVAIRLCERPVVREDR